MHRRSLTRIRRQRQRRADRMEKLYGVETMLNRSCKQIILLNDKIRGLTKRYNQARADGYKSFRYNLRVKIATFEGIRNMFYEFAQIRAEEVAKLRRILFNENVVIVSGNERREFNTDGEETSEGTDEDDDDMEEILV